MSFRHAIPTAAMARAMLCALVLLSIARTAFADPADYVFTPYAETGMRELAYGLGTEHDRDGSRETQQTLGFGGTPTARWYSSVYAAWAANDGGAFVPDEWSWTNHLKLTTPGESPVDVGLLCELARPHDREEGRLGATCGPTLQMDTDQVQLNFNPLLGKQFGAEQSQRWQLGYQWQAKHMVAHGVELGAQGFGSVGTWNHWATTSQQENTVGPAIFLKTAALGGTIHLDGAWLIGIGGGSIKNLLRVRLQHEF